MRKKRLQIMAWAAALCLMLTACGLGAKKEVTHLPSILDNAPRRTYNSAPVQPEPAAPSQPEPEPVPEAAPDEITGTIPEEPEAAPGESEEPPENLGEGPPEASEASGIDTEGLRAALEAELSTCTGTWALYWKRLDTGETISIGDEKMTAASLIKLFVAGAYYEAAEAGRIAGNSALVRPMITDSSNDACNSLIDLLGDGDATKGMEAVNQFAASIGCASSQLNRKMLEQTGVENYTSVSDCGRVLEMIYNGTYVSAGASAELLGYLKQQSRTHKIPAGVPAGVETANKTGELSGVENDAAIVWAPSGAYVLCVMSDDILSPAAGQGNIAGLSKMVYDYLENPENG